MKRKNLSHLLLLLLFNALAVYAAAATKYVSNSGNNGNSGNSWAQAWLTIQYAEDHIAAGDTVWVANGTYTGFDVRITGTAANPIVFIAAGNSVVINVPTGTTDLINVENANYIEINGFRCINSPRNGIRLVNAHNCIVRNNYCESSFERGIFTGFTDDILIEYNECLTSDDELGIYVSNSSDRSVIRYNVCHHNNRGGIQINADASQGGDGISTDPEIYGNILYENGNAGGAAINLDGVQGAFIYNNLLYQNHASGIALFQQDGAEPSIDADIVHNTIVNASNARWCILIVNGSSGAQVFNNIIINQHAWRGSIALDPDAEPGFNSDYNIVVNSLSNEGDGVTMTFEEWQDLGYDEHSMLADPLGEIFVGHNIGNYHLSANSQAINAGDSGSAFGVDEDIEGVIRPQGAQHDIGAYEHQGSLAIDEEEEGTGSPSTQYGIVITSGKILWPEMEGSQLQIINAAGQVLHSQDTDDDGEFGFDHFATGIYLAVISDTHRVLWVKGFFVKE
jgi:parallel beta-helix repeat protein